MRSDTQPSRFVLMTAFHLRDIQAELGLARRPDQGVAPSPEPGRAEARQPEVGQAGCADLDVSAASPGRRSVPPLLDALTAELLDSGSLMFAADCFVGWSAEPAWHVFSGQRADADAGDGVLLFEQAGVIGGELADNDFVDLAYQTILQRQADPGGHRAYAETLQSGQKTRYGVLRDLANSIEAADTGRLLVILPGNWLAAGLDACEALPEAVRIDMNRLPPAAAPGASPDLTPDLAPRQAPDHAPDRVHDERTLPAILTRVTAAA